MKMKLIWDESKRLENMGKHGLDFVNAEIVLDSRYRMDVLTVRGVEIRMQSFSYVMDRLAVLTVVHIDRDNATRIISFRSASKNESEAYYEWINQEND
jgi:uncharacterized DUF497 family protein